eukprot:Nk52_evm6s299 gene=Nk52_evmTU6s299
MVAEEGGLEGLGDLQVQGMYLGGGGSEVEGEQRKGGSSDSSGEGGSGKQGAFKCVEHGLPSLAALSHDLHMLWEEYSSSRAKRGIDLGLGRGMKGGIGLGGGPTSNIDAQTNTYNEFVECWESINFSMIHLVFPLTQSQLHFPWLEEIYRKTLSILLQDKYETKELEMFSVFTLYTLYMTQVCEPKVRIQLPHTLMKRLVGIKRRAKKEHMHEVVYILDKMSREGAFDYSIVMDSTKKSHAKRFEENSRADFNNPQIHISDDRVLCREFAMRVGKVPRKPIHSRAFLNLSQIGEKYEMLKIDLDAKIEQMKQQRPFVAGPLKLTNSTLSIATGGLFRDFESKRASRLALPSHALSSQGRGTGLAMETETGTSSPMSFLSHTPMGNFFIPDENRDTEKDHSKFEIDIDELVGGGTGTASSVDATNFLRDSNRLAENMAALEQVMAKADSQAATPTRGIKRKDTDGEFLSGLSTPNNSIHDDCSWDTKSLKTSDTNEAVSQKEKSTSESGSKNSSELFARRKMLRTRTLRPVGNRFRQGF